MGSIAVEQVAWDGSVVRAPDARLSERKRNELFLEALPGARSVYYDGQRAIHFRDQLLFKRQITHLGRPWPEFKKRIQIPNAWVNAHDCARNDGFVPRFVGIYYWDGVTIFVDFDPRKYVLREVNNSAAHVSTNDLYQAQMFGVFARRDRNGNSITSVRADLFADYLTGDLPGRDPRVEVFSRFNDEFLNDERIESLDAIQEMYAADWPDTFQAEWPGFYLEYRLADFVQRQNLTGFVEYQKVKGRGEFDYDLVFRDGHHVDFFGDLKASDLLRSDSPGNDAAALARCVDLHDRFWYVVYEHQTWHSRDNRDVATVKWNEWKRSVGRVSSGGFSRFSYAGKFKEAVRFEKMFILELNEANFHVALGDFNQGRQPSGAERALKVMIKKRNIENFLIYSGGVR